MKIICNEEEKKQLKKIFDNAGSECPFNGDSPFCFSMAECSECMDYMFPIEWEIINYDI